MNSSLRAHIQFIRFLDVSCSSKEIIWNVSGDYIKRILSQESEQILNIDIFLYSQDQNVLQQVLKELKIMKVIKTIQTSKDNTAHVCCDVEILNEEFIHSFDVTFYLNCSRVSSSSFDNIILSPLGLTLGSLDLKNDEYNANTGIALLERLVDSQLKEVKLSGFYLNLNSNYSVRKKNARLMRTQESFLNENYTILGNSNLKIIKSSEDEECPICYERDLFCTKLKCAHLFCVQCLASHMDKLDNHSGTCPLCRGLIELDY